MKIFMCTDMEGVAGMIDHDEWVVPSGRYYEQGKELLTREVNAALRGLFEGGADEIHVLDGHGYGGLIPSLLDPRALYIRCLGVPWPLGLDTGCNGMCWIGQHAKSGTARAHMPHTGSMHVLDMRINDISVGEFGQFSFIARELGVPPFFVTGDDAMANEADRLYPGIVTVKVKRGLTADAGDECDADAYRSHNLSAVHMHPEVACDRIREGAQRAMRLLRGGLPYNTWPINGPFVKTVRYRKSGERPAYIAEARHPASVIGLMHTHETVIG